MEKKRESLLSKILGLIFIIWFIASIVGLIYFSKINGYYTVMIFGQYFCVFGIFGFKAKWWVGLLFEVVGLSCLVIPYLMLNPDILANPINWENLIINFIFIGLVVAGFIIISYTYLRNRKLMKVCTCSVTAKVVDNLIMRKDRCNYYCPTYKFWFNGKFHEIKNDFYSRAFIEVGTDVELLINPDIPSEFINPNKSLTKYAYFFGIVFILVGILYFIVIGGGVL